MKFNRFTKGTGVYTCDCCGRRTRDTGDGAMNGICGMCYELAGYENLIQDGEELSKRDIQEIRKVHRTVS